MPINTTYPNAAGWGPIAPTMGDTANTPAIPIGNTQQISIDGNPLYPSATNWTALRASSTSIVEGSLGQRAIGLAAGAVGSIVGIPQVSQFAGSLIDANAQGSVKSEYAVADPSNLKNIPGVKYADFRVRKAKGDAEGVLKQRLDASSLLLRTTLSAATGKTPARNVITPAIYAAAAASPFGAYSAFNREATYGWGDHDNPFALRNDFTVQSHVATQWRPGKTTKKEWLRTKSPLSYITPFRGDKVNVIDFGKRTLKEAYRWRPKNFGEKLDFLDKAGITRDFIKFYITGPKLNAGNTTDVDDIIVFRASINSLTDTFGSNWSEVKMIGRADPNYQYSGYSRDISLDFTLFATDRDEVKPIWRKLNALAGYTAPTYDDQNIALVGSWLRITIGDLFVQQAAVIKSLNYTLYDAESPWEINIEGDPEMMEVPIKIDVSLSLSIIADWLPQKNGRFYSLAKQYDGKTGLPKEGTDNWLSGAEKNKTLDLKKLKLELENKNKTEDELTALLPEVDNFDDPPQP